MTPDCEKYPILLVARLGSTRLPQKMLADLAGKTVLERLAERLVHSHRVSKIILCTTTLAPDDALVAMADRIGIECFRGDPEDVPQRLFDAATEFNTDFFVMVEGDEVFADPESVDQVIGNYRKTHADVIKFYKVPLGAWLTGLSTAALGRMCARKKRGPVDGWIALFEGDAVFEDLTPDPPLPPFSPQLRMTLDYPEDLQFIRAVVEKLKERAPGAPGLRGALELVNEQPELLEINRHLTDTYWSRLKARGSNNKS